MVRFYFNIFSSLLMKFFGSVPHVQFIELFSSGLVRFRFCWTEFCLIVVLLEGDLFGRCVVGGDFFDCCALEKTCLVVVLLDGYFFDCCALEKTCLVVVLLKRPVCCCCAVRRRTEFNFVHV